MTPPGWYPDPVIPNTLRWWTGEEWSEHVSPMPQQTAPQSPVMYQPQAILVQPGTYYKTSHGFHLIMSIITFGLWIPVWIIVGIMNASRN